MYTDILEWLRCPTCHSTTLLLEGRTFTEIDTGLLSCESCGAEYPIEDGIPFLLPPELLPEVLARSAAAPSEEFESYQTETTPAVARLIKKLARSAGVVLDLGSGRAPYLPLLSCDVICLDIFPHFLRDLPKAVGNRVRVHPICASASRVPIREGAADLVFASELVEHLHPADAHRALVEWPRLARQWCVVDTPNGHEDAWLTRLRHAIYRTETMTAVEHPELPELDHHSTFSPDDFRAAGYECHGSIGWVSRRRFPVAPLWDIYDLVAWRFPSIAGTLIAVSPGRAQSSTPSS